MKMLLRVNMLFTQLISCHRVKEREMFLFTYVAEEVLEVVASGIVVGIQNSSIQVLLLMISFPVVEL